MNIHPIFIDYKYDVDNNEMWEDFDADSYDQDAYNNHSTNNNMNISITEWNHIHNLSYNMFIFKGYYKEAYQLYEYMLVNNILITPSMIEKSMFLLLSLGRAQDNISMFESMEKKFQCKRNERHAELFIEVSIN